MNNNKALTVAQSPQALSTYSDTDKLVAAGKIANGMAQDNVFGEHLQYKSEETKKSYKAALKLFSQALGEIGINRSVDNLMDDPEAWRGVTWAIVKGYRDVLMNGGLNKMAKDKDTGEMVEAVDKNGQPIPLFFAVSSVNQRLSIVRKMADLAGQADVIPTEEQLKIRGVKGYTSKTGKRADETREAARISNQKDASNFLTKQQVSQLLESLPETPQGRRDQLMLAMLAYLGMRVSELAGMKISDIDLSLGVVNIYRQKTDTHSKLDMPVALRQILVDYLEVRPNCEHDYLLVSSIKSSKLVCRAMSKRAIQGRVRTLGSQILDIDNLSPHDMRHTLSEALIEADVSEAAIMDVLGWKTSAMVHHYRKQNKVVSVPDVWR